MSNLSSTLCRFSTFLIAISSGLISSVGFAASFDCAKAVSNVEKAICASATLSRLDSEMATAYQAAKRHTDERLLLIEQRDWLKQSRNKCTTERCLHDAYDTRIAFLSVEGDVDVDPDALSTKRALDPGGTSEPKKDHLLASAPNDIEKLDPKTEQAISAINVIFAVLKSDKLHHGYEGCLKKTEKTLRDNNNKEAEALQKQVNNAKTIRERKEHEASLAPFLALNDEVYRISAAGFCADRAAIEFAKALDLEAFHLSDAGLTAISDGINGNEFTDYLFIELNKILNNSMIALLYLEVSNKAKGGARMGDLINEYSMKNWELPQDYSGIVGVYAQMDLKKSEERIRGLINFLSLYQDKLSY